MENPVEREEPLESTKEPPKAHNSATTANSDDRSDGANSPPPNCSICLGKLINTSFTDSCLHQFCFTCLLQWSRIKTECPLCKQTFKSIIHNVRSEEDYDQYHVPRELAPPSAAAGTTIEVNFAVARASVDVALRRFAYRTTMTPNRHFELLISPNQLPRSESNHSSPESREERRPRRVTPHTRRNVYRSGEWMHPLSEMYSRFHECSAEYFRRHPAELERLIPWINRDLQLHLITNQAHIAYVLRAIMDYLKRYDMRSSEFRDALRPYFDIRTDHFIHELIRFAQTGLDITTYESFYSYGRYPAHGLGNGYWNRVQSPPSSTSSSSSDSDIRVVNRVNRISEAPRMLPYSLSEPGPSTVGEPFRDSARLSPYILTISTSSSESECEVVGYVKPRHERTPEIIELASSGEDATVNNVPDTPRSPSPEPYPSTSQGNGKRNSKKSKSPQSRLQDLAKEGQKILSLTCKSSSDSDSDNIYTRLCSKRTSGKELSRDSTKSSSLKTSQCRSGNSKKRNKHSSSSTDSNRDKKRRRNVRTNGRNRLVISDSSDDEQFRDNKNKEGRTSRKREHNPYNVRIRTDLMVPHNDDSSSSSSTSSISDSSSLSSSTSSSLSNSSSSSSSDSHESDKLLNKVSTRSTRRIYYSKNNVTNQSNETSENLQKRLKSAIIKPVTTVLRKDAEKKEWYIDKNSSRSRSLSRSSCDSHQPTSSRQHSTTNEYRSRIRAQRIGGERLKSSDFYLSADDSQNEEKSQRSNSQSSTRSDKTNSSEKHKSKHKDKNKDKKETRSKASTSKVLSKYSESKNNSEKRNKHKKHNKTTKTKQSKTKSKRYSSDEDSSVPISRKKYSLRHYNKNRTTYSFSSSSSSLEF